MNKKDNGYSLMLWAQLFINAAIADGFVKNKSYKSKKNELTLEKDGISIFALIRPGDLPTGKIEIYNQKGCKIETPQYYSWEAILENAEKVTELKMEKVKSTCCVCGKEDADFSIPDGMSKSRKNRIVSGLSSISAICDECSEKRPKRICENPEYKELERKMEVVSRFIGLYGRQTKRSPELDEAFQDMQSFLKAHEASISEFVSREEKRTAFGCIST